MKGQVKTAFYFIIDHRKNHLINCREEEAVRVLGTKRELDATKLDVFIALLHDICVSGKKFRCLIFVEYKIWRPAFF